MRALDALPPAQALNRANPRRPCGGILCARAAAVAIREDVGRHNALDKLAGALARRRVPAASGICAVHQPGFGRNDPETAAIGAPLVVAVSAPTALAVRMADAAGITAGRGGAQRRFRDLHPPDRIPKTASRTGARSCRMRPRRTRASRPTSSSIWRTRSASSSPAKAERGRRRNRRAHQEILGSADARRDLRASGSRRRGS